jgi:hypothetical protein
MFPLPHAALSHLDRPGGDNPRASRSPRADLGATPGSGAAGQARSGWMMGIARAISRAPREPTPRQRRWAMLRALAAETRRNRLRDGRRWRS